MPGYPQIVEYNEAVQSPRTAFIDPDLKKGKVAENNLGLPLALSGGFALTYMVSTNGKRVALRCFHRQVPSVQERYEAISRTLKSINAPFFVDFKYIANGIRIRGNLYPIVCMDWVEGETLGIFLDAKFTSSATLKKVREDFRELARFLQRSGIAHGDIQNGNVMISKGAIRLIDYDGMYVPGLPIGQGNEIGHKHFQHPKRSTNHFGPDMDRFSFIVVDLSLLALIEDASLYTKFREGGETIIFKANDFADPANSEVFRLLMARPSLKTAVERFARVCEAPISQVPTVEDFLAGRNIPTVKIAVLPPPGKGVPEIAPPRKEYIAPFPVVDARDYAAAEKQIGNRVELIGQIVEVSRRFARNRRPYVFINFGPWRGKIVKVTIWSEGLATFTTPPSASWVGKWISVTGLIDPPYMDRRGRYTHLSITVANAGQIHHIEEKEAKYRLASVGVSPSASNRSILEGMRQKGTRNQQILDQLLRASQGKVGSSPSGGPSPPHKSPSPPISKSPPTQTPAWVYVLGVIVLILLLMAYCAR